MNKKSNKLKFEELIKESKEKEVIKTYEEFLETEEAKEYALTQEEVNYYTSKYLESKKDKIKITP